MSRVVYVGGFGNGKCAAGRVANALLDYYEDVDTFTFSQAMASPDEVRRATKGVPVVSHSAGMLALRHTWPKRIDALNAPLPSSKLALVGHTLIKTARMHIPGIGIRALADIRGVATYDVSSTAELSAHLVGNLRRLGAIANFNAIEAAASAQHEHVPVTLGYTDGDEYFAWDDADRQRASDLAVQTVRLPGIHDELVIRPEAMLAEYYA